ncbi:MAG: guanylate kinase [Bacteroidetes bacterium]|nr:guanylate kinase [Bacteroidota bacterium]MDA0879784.1 guanylate kinase [Bacteroidota bacterium]MDA1115772.1 guanylate kinase [Bacteroidota bacterium]
MIQEKLVVFSAPSGSGKTTIVRHLLTVETLPLAFSISATTRAPRGKEINGKDYYFLSVEEFKERIEQGHFLEWEEVYPNQYYGTLKSEVVRLWQSGKAVLFDLDVVGGLAIKRQFPEQTLAIFVQPPNLETLIERLKNRKTEDQIALNKRIDKAPAEMVQAKFFDAILINDDLEQAFEKASSLVSNFLNSD